MRSTPEPRRRPTHFLAANARFRDLATEAVLLDVTGAKPLTDEHRGAARYAKIFLGDGKTSPLNDFSFELMNTRSLAEFRNTLSGHQLSRGSSLVPDGWLSAWEFALDSNSAVRNVATVVRSSNLSAPDKSGAHTVSEPLVQDTANEGYIVGENASQNATDPTFGQLIFLLKDYRSGKLKVPMHLVEDAPNFATGIARLAAERVSRRQNRQFTLGVGGLTLSAYDGGATSAAATTVSADDLDNTIALVGSEHIKGAQWMMHPSVWIYCRKLKSGSGARLFNDGKLADFPVILNPHMSSSIAANEVTALFGNFTRYKIVDFDEVRLGVFVEAAIENGQILYEGYQATDAILMDGGDHPVSRLVQHA